jgi:uncharacterized protein (TIRG00374 family)
VESNKKPKTIKFSIIISLLLSIGIIILILLFTFDARTITYLSDHTIRYEFFVGAIIANIFYWILWGIRLQILSNAVDKNFRIKLLESIKIVMTNLFLANITPSMAGGEPVRIYLLNKNGLNVGCSTAAVLGERFLDALFLIICFPFAFFVFRGRINSGPLNIGLTIAVVVFILLVLAFFYCLKYPEKTKSFLIFISLKFRKFSKKKDGEIVQRIQSEVDNFHMSMRCFLVDKRKAFLNAGIITAIFWMVGWMVPIFILLGLGLQPFIIESTAAQILLIIIVMMPTTPGSAGVTEGGAAALYSVFIPSSLVGIFILLFRLITYHLGLITGAIFQYRIFKTIASFSFEAIQTRRE